MLTPYKVVERVKKLLFEAEDRRLQAWIDKLAKQNQEAQGNPRLEGFIYNGTYYRTSTTGLGNWPHGALHHSLSDQMEVLEKDKAIIDQDRAFIGQMLGKLLRPCDSYQDMRDALPDCLVNIIPELSPLPRSLSVAYTIDGDARALRQFNEILPKIELYVAARMMF
jgi:hypothetical protein